MIRFETIFDLLGVKDRHYPNFKSFSTVSFTYSQPDYYVFKMVSHYWYMGFTVPALCTQTNVFINPWLRLKIHNFTQFLI